MCSFFGCNLSIPFSLGEAVPLSGDTGSCKTKYLFNFYYSVNKPESLFFYYGVSLYDTIRAIAVIVFIIFLTNLYFVSLLSLN